MPESTAVVLREEPSVELGTVRATNPAQLVQAATAAANELAGVIERQKLFSNIQGRRYVRCEGWTTLGAMLGVIPREHSVVRSDDGTYTAVVELVRMHDGVVLTRASAECGGREKPWDTRPDYARRSMALTRATSKAARLCFSWVMSLAGFEVTPAEEVPEGDFDHQEQGQRETTVWTLPGAPDKWNGNGGKPLSEVPPSVLGKALKFLGDASRNVGGKNDALIDAIEVELETRGSREAA